MKYYRLMNQTTANVLENSYSYDTVNNITTISDAVDAANDQDFGYDNLDRLDSAQGRYGNLTYDYDAVGNRLTENQDSNTDTYGYATDSQQLTRITGTNPSSLNYDANGNLISQDSDR